MCSKNARNLSGSKSKCADLSIWKWSSGRIKEIGF